MDTRFRALDKKATALAFALALIAILGALGSQVFAGLVPCELCLEQRIAYYIGVPLLAVILLLWNRMPLSLWYVGIAIAALVFAWSTYMGAFHAGVEWGFWPGPTACTGLGEANLSFDSLGGDEIEAVIPCDHVQFRFLGISLAGYNALASVAVVVLLLIALGDQYRRNRKPQA